MREHAGFDGCRFVRAADDGIEIVEVACRGIPRADPRRVRLDDAGACARDPAQEHLRLLLERCGTVCRRGRDGLGRRPQGLDRQPWILTGS